MRKKKVTKMSMKALRRLVLEEAAKMTGELQDVEKVKAEEVEAGDLADTLEQDIDLYKAAKIKEARLRKQYKQTVQKLRKLRETRQKARRRILRKLK
tara:strand:+ start:601 stop:891 length:291 start_codon:yes stop_codon:yes gene_type:complete